MCRYLTLRDHVRVVLNYDPLAENIGRIICEILVSCLCMKIIMIVHLAGKIKSLKLFKRLHCIILNTIFQMTKWRRACL